MPSDSFTIAIFMWITVGYCNMLLLCTAAPFLLSHAVEGVVIARRHGDARPLAFALLGTVTATVVGVAIWHFAVEAPGVPETFESEMLTASSYVLPIATAVAIGVYAVPHIYDRMLGRRTESRSPQVVASRELVGAGS